MSRSAAVTALTVGALALLAPAASAQREPSFALKALGAGERGFFVLDAQPGQVLSGRVLVVNAGRAAGTARLDAVDATTGTTTGAVYETVGARTQETGAWLRLERSTVTLDAGGSATVGFTVTVPPDARPGDHLGGIVAAPAQPPDAAEGDADDRSFRVDVVNQAVLAVQVVLPGTARSVLRVEGVRPGGGTGYQTLLLDLSNPGERMVRGSGRVRVVDANGEPAGDQRFAIDTFLPGTRIEYPLVVRGKALRPGEYRATVELDWGADRSSEEFGFTVSERNIEQAFGPEGVATLEDADERGGGAPVVPIAVGGLLALLVLAALLRMRGKTRRLEEALAERAAQDRDERFSPGAREPGPSERTRR